MYSRVFITQILKNHRYSIKANIYEFNVISSRSEDKKTPLELRCIFNFIGESHTVYVDISDIDLVV